MKMSSIRDAKIAGLLITLGLFPPLFFILIGLFSNLIYFFKSGDGASLIAVFSELQGFSFLTIFFFLVAMIMLWIHVAKYNQVSFLRKFLYVYFFVLPVNYSLLLAIFGPKTNFFLYAILNGGILLLALVVAKKTIPGYILFRKSIDQGKS